MADITLTVDQGTFPIGTEVDAYPVSELGVLPTSHPTGAPAGTADDTATVAADGTLDFTGLTAGVRYFAYAEVSSTHRYVGFSPGALASGSSRITHDADSDTVDIRAENLTITGGVLSISDVGGTIALKSPDGTAFNVTVSDAGAIVVTAA